jgi:predicted small lipoprotein YifL
MKLQNIIASFLMVFTLTGCGYDGHYRYPCQDPVNWENEECKPPICTANGACPEDLVDINGNEGAVNE